ncbi:hypothetical protein COSO111634_25060 [Corallococcus soli]
MPRAPAFSRETRNAKPGTPASFWAARPNHSASTASLAGVGCPCMPTSSSRASRSDVTMRSGAKKDSVSTSTATAPSGLPSFAGSAVARMRSQPPLAASRMGDVVRSPGGRSSARRAVSPISGTSPSRDTCESERRSNSRSRSTPSPSYAAMALYCPTASSSARSSRRCSARLPGWDISSPANRRFLPTSSSESVTPPTASSSCFCRSPANCSTRVVRLRFTSVQTPTPTLASAAHNSRMGRSVDRMDGPQPNLTRRPKSLFTGPFVPPALQYLPVDGARWPVLPTGR